MPASQRRPDAGVIAQLFAQPHRFEFFQAVSLIGLWLRQHGVDRTQLFDQHLRFGNRLSLSFPPSQLAALNAMSGQLTDHAEDIDAAIAQGRAQIRMVPAFFSLLGATGVMPAHYTERIAAHERQARSVGEDGGGPRAFLDMLSTRSAVLFYQAWAQQRPEHMADADGQEGFLVMLSALAGVAPAPRGRAGRVRGRPAPPCDGRDNERDDEFDEERNDERDNELDAEVAAFYAAQLSCRAVPATMIAGVLADYFNVPVTLRQLIACWEPLPLRDQARLGRANVALSDGVMPGTRILQRHRRAELRIGPLSSADLRHFLPGESAARALGKLLALFCGVDPRFVARLVLRREDVIACRLPGCDGGGPRLGIDAFLLDRVLESAAARDRDDLCYLLPL